MTQFLKKKLLKSILTSPVNGTQDPHKKRNNQHKHIATQTNTYTSNSI